MTTTTAAGIAVQHLQGCACEDRETDPALMYDERTVISDGLTVAILNELEKRLRKAGRLVLQHRRERWNAAGDHIGPELAIRSCETEIVWQVAQETRELLDRLVGEMLA